jgi:uncharacterized protein YidB (DUF937 family)
VIECGYNPGPTAVELRDQTTAGGTVTVDGVELADGGFVAVHRLSFVDGAFAGSLLGVSGRLSAGLHRDVEVDLTRRVAANATLIAVVYRDSDDDGEFDFAATGGAVDRPYTNTYSERAGNVTDEAGDVIGDAAAVTVVDLVAQYAGTDGVVGDAELQAAIGDWVAGDLSDADLRELIDAWVTGGPEVARSVGADAVAPGESVTVTLTAAFGESRERVSVADGYDGPVASARVDSVAVGGDEVEPRFAGVLNWGGIQVVFDRDVPANTEVRVTYTVTVEADAGGDTLRVPGAPDRPDVSVPGVTAEFGTATVAVERT